MRRFLLFFALVGLVVWFGVPRVVAAWNHHVAATTVTAAQAPLVDAAAEQFKVSTTQLIQNNPNITTSITLIDLQSDKTLSAGSKAPFEAASTAKVLSAVLYIHQVEQGTSTMSSYIQGDTARSLLQRMLNQSDNSAWQSINDYLTHNALKTYATSIGMSSYDPDANQLTAADEAHLLAQLFKRQLLNEQDTSLLLGYMQDTNNETLIPAALPVGATVYHKFGLLDDNLHDAAIITYQGRSFVVVIYTNNTVNDDTAVPAAQTTLIHQLTAAAIGYEKAQSA